jgi:hypothetical protein
MRPHYGGHHNSHYGTSPHQVHQYPQQPSRGTPSAHYVQPMMHGGMPGGIPPQAGPVLTGGEGGVEDGK